MEVISLEIDSREEEFAYSPPIINVNRNSDVLPHIRITRYYSMNQLTYAQWQEELTWFRDINGILDRLEVDAETKLETFNFLGKKIYQWYHRFREFEPIENMSHHRAKTHLRWVRSVYRTVLSEKLNWHLAESACQVAVDICLKRMRDPDARDA